MARKTGVSNIKTKKNRFFTETASVTLLEQNNFGIFRNRKTASEASK